MIGNQVIINQQIIEHEDNPIKGAIGEKDVDDIIYVITDEYWKEWRRLLTHSDKPHIYAPGLGYFSLMYGKSKSYLRKLLSRLRNIKRKYPEKYLVEGTRANGLYKATLSRFRETWKQVDNLKKEVNEKYRIWEEKKAAKYGKNNNMNKYIEYLKLIPKGLSNPKQVLEGWINNYNFDNLKPDEVKEILKRRAICEECPLNSVNAKTSEEYKKLFGSNYFTNREELHCSICSCIISKKTASLSSNCGLEVYNQSNPNNIQPLKWTKYNETAN